MSNLDRFSSPLASERVHPFQMQQAIKEQQELNKITIIDNYISDAWNHYGLVPDVEEIQERFYNLDLDQDMINERLELF